MNDRSTSRAFLFYCYDFYPTPLSFQVSLTINSGLYTENCKRQLVIHFKIFSFSLPRRDVIIQIIVFILPLNCYLRNNFMLRDFYWDFIHLKRAELILRSGFSSVVKEAKKVQLHSTHPTHWRK